MKIIFALALTFLLLLCAPAQAQRQCTRATPFEHTAPTGPVEIVVGKADQRVYYCGFMIAEKGQTLDFKVWTGTGSTCLGPNQVFLTPQWSLPNDFAIVNRIEQVGVYSDYGQSLCIQTFGVGGLTGVIYWEQF